MVFEALTSNRRGYWRESDIGHGLELVLVASYVSRRL